MNLFLSLIILKTERNLNNIRLPPRNW